MVEDEEDGVVSDWQGTKRAFYGRLALPFVSAEAFLGVLLTQAGPRQAIPGSSGTVRAVIAASDGLMFDVSTGQNFEFIYDTRLGLHTEQETAKKKARVKEHDASTKTAILE